MLPMAISRLLDKLRFAFRASDANLTFSLWHPQRLLTAGALEISVGLAVPKSVLLPAKPSANGIPQFQKLFVFCAPLCEVF